MQFTIDYLEYFILVFIRIASMMVTAPFFNSNNFPRLTKMGLSFYFSLVAVGLMDFSGLSYDGILGFATLVLQEGITGAIIGLASGLCLYILNFCGNMIDMEIGFSMAMEFDPATNVQSTITSTLFSQLFLALFVISDMHYFIIDAVYDSYKLLPIGGANLKGDFLSVMSTYITDYFVLGFRIILPIFSCILIINVVLGILAKVAPQMNMFVIGMQLKIFIGLFLLFMLMGYLPNIVDFLFTEMQKMTKLFLQQMT